MASYFSLDHKPAINPIVQHPVASASVKSSGSVTNCRMILIIKITSGVPNTLGLSEIQTIGGNIASHIQSMPTEIVHCNGIAIGKQLAE
ncbi:hypothetical protein A1342_22415 [Methylomonas methanica]|uniref:Uncharacterized protein n=1 Tax=Methylomonas denitrificans TaxID=1538553 RepID=A0A126T573_9GAMM|nr:hypothetical protein JT25_012150 [Methylomonas denitrificans]OAI07173.1 hypothetical protein A1342_22415 [Methylomonas methanica]